MQSIYRWVPFYKFRSCIELYQRRSYQEESIRLRYLYENINIDLINPLRTKVAIMPYIFYL